jgi:hypothetical protein
MRVAAIFGPMPKFGPIPTAILIAVSLGFAACSRVEERTPEQPAPKANPADSQPAPPAPIPKAPEIHAADPLSTPRSAMAHQLEMIRAANVEGLKRCFVESLRAELTPEVVEAGQKRTGNPPLEDLAASITERTEGGKKIASVKLKSGAVLTELVLEGDHWLADRIWFR